MRRKIMGIILVMGLFTACSRTAVPKEENASDYNRFVRSGGVFTWSEEGSYANANNLLYVFQDSGELSILCADPACRHGDESCSAYMPYNAYASGNHLYYVVEKGQKRILYRESLTGTNREEVKVLTDLQEDEAVTSTYAIYQNHLVMVLQETTVEGMVQKVYGTKLNTRDELELLSTEELMLFRLLEEEALFFQVNEKGRLDLVSLNYETKHKKIIVKDLAEKLDFLADVYVDKQGTAFWFDMTGFYRSGDQGEKILIREADKTVEVGGALYDDQYIYLLNSNQYLDQAFQVPAEMRGLRIYDHAGKLLSFAPWDSTKEGKELSYALASAQRVFYFTFGQDTRPTDYLDKTEIGNPTLTWKKVHWLQD